MNKSQENESQVKRQAVVSSSQIHPNQSPVYSLRCVEIGRQSFIIETAVGTDS